MTLAGWVATGWEGRTLANAGAEETARDTDTEPCTEHAFAKRPSIPDTPRRSATVSNPFPREEQGQRHSSSCPSQRAHEQLVLPSLLRSLFHLLNR